jgi:hypothetical protein
VPADVVHLHAKRAAPRLDALGPRAAWPPPTAGAARLVPLREGGFIILWSATCSDQFHVLIAGPYMSREDLVVRQYFLRLLHEPREGRRVVYAESRWEQPQALDLLGTHLLDGSVGEPFFGDYLRMHRDLLGDAAKQYLPHLLPK